MLILRLSVGAFAAAMMVSNGGAAPGPAYPNKPIRIVTSEAGGGSDLSSRIIAARITGPLGQPLIVENRGGGGGIVTIETVAHASPDGYTVLYYTSGLWTLPLIQTAPYDPVKEFSPITLVTQAPNILVVNPAIPATSVAELIALAKAKPGALNYASGPTGASSHLAPELFKFMTGVDIVRVPYKGAGPAANGVISGEAQVMFPAAGSAAAHIKSGRMRALAVTSAKPSLLFPGMPTIAASGVPGYESVSIVGLFAPAKTPPAVINRLNLEVVKVLNQDEVKEKLLSLGVEAAGSSPAELAATMKSEMTRLGKMIRDAGIHAD